MAGLYGLNSHELIDIEHCAVQHSQTNEAVNTVKKILEELKITIYNEKSRKGIVRTIVTRVGVQTGELQVVLITNQTELPKKDLIIQEIQKRLPKVTSIVQNINEQKTSTYFW